jgi:hypothetical protein
MTDDELRARAAALAGEPVDALESVRGGGNNRLYRVRAAARSYALKRYPDDPVDARARFGPEFGGLRFLWAAGERRIPEPVALDEVAGLALYGWIDGGRVASAAPADVEQMAAFARALHAVRTAPGAAALPPAREAVLAPGDLAAQLRGRLARLRAVESEHAALVPLLRDLAREVHRRESPGSGTPLDPALRTLSPSDFGLHNALVTPAGLVFVDFEYFGWDDPVKLVADVVWHPGMALAPAAGEKFFAAVADCYMVDPDFCARFERDAPLYGLRWALIVLGEFLPDVWARRAAAGAVDRPATLRRQLAKADALLARSRAGSVFA